MRASSWWWARPLVIATGFSASSEAAFAAVSSAITLIMVFVIQHTQSREQRALQVKLDELVRALPQADDSFVHVEGSSDEELQELEVRHIESTRPCGANDQQGDFWLRGPPGSPSVRNLAPTGVGYLGGQPEVAMSENSMGPTSGPQRLDETLKASQVG